MSKQGVDLTWIQLKLQHIINDDNTNSTENDFTYAFPSCEAVPLCSMAHKAIHSYRADYLQLWSICVGVGQSVLNPVVYAFWYPQFRSQGRALMKGLKASWRREYLSTSIGLP